MKWRSDIFVCLMFVCALLTLQNSVGQPVINSIGIIRSFDEIRDDFQRFDEHTLVLFDIDDTLLSCPDIMACATDWMVYWLFGLFT